MAPSKVLLTGATGFIGFRILRTLLDHKYAVRIVVRSEAKAGIVSSALKAYSEYASASYEFIGIPDFTSPQAFDEAVQGVSFIIHAAAPVPFGKVDPKDFESHFVDTAVKGTLGILSAAHKSFLVKRVILLSSAIASIPIQYLGGPGPAAPDTDVYGSESRAPMIPQPWPIDFVAYAAGKIASQDAAEEWIKEHKPSFDWISFLPAYVLGRAELATTTQELLATSNSVVLRLAAGLTVDGQPTEACGFVHVNDLALLHVLALDMDRVAGDQRYLYINISTWDVCREVIGKTFATAIESGLISNSGMLGTKALNVDNSKVERTFVNSMEFATLDQMVQDGVGQYIELLEKERMK